MVVDADADLLARLRAGDEDAFMELVDRYGPLMLRIALAHVPRRAIAEDVVGDAWLGVVTGLERFEGRSQPEDLAAADRHQPRAHAGGEANAAASRSPRWRPTTSRAVDPDRFQPLDHPRYPGGWAQPPAGLARGAPARRPRRSRRSARRSPSSRPASRR